MSAELPIRREFKFDCEKAHRDSKHVTKLLSELSETQDRSPQERFCHSGSPSVKGRADSCITFDLPSRYHHVVHKETEKEGKEIAFRLR